MIVAVPFVQPWLRKHQIEDRKLIVWPMVFCGLFCLFFFNYSNDLSRFVRIALFTIGSVAVIFCRSLPTGAIMSLGSKIVSSKNVPRMQLWITVGLDLGRAAGPPIGSYSSQNVWAAVMLSLCALLVFTALPFVFTHGATLLPTVLPDKKESEPQVKPDVQPRA